MLENEWPIEPDPWVFLALICLGLALCWLIFK